MARARVVAVAVARCEAHKNPTGGREWPGKETGRAVVVVVVVVVAGRACARVRACARACACVRVRVRVRVLWVGGWVC